MLKQAVLDAKHAAIWQACKECSRLFPAGIEDDRSSASSKRIEIALRPRAAGASRFIKDGVVWAHPVKTVAHIPGALTHKDHPSAEPQRVFRSMLRHMRVHALFVSLTG